MKASLKSKENTYAYFPGCSLAASGHENNRSIYKFCEKVGIHLEELDDWNCCGSSSAHSIDSEAAALLPQRNISLAQQGLPLLVACPSCYIRMRSTHEELKSDDQAKEMYKNRWERNFDQDLEIIHFFDLLTKLDQTVIDKNMTKPLNGIRFASYYGCMLAKPPILRKDKRHTGIMEKTLKMLGAEPVSWQNFSKCCGTYLSVAKPEVTTKVVNQIMDNAIESEAECLVTACAMCHLNLEIRCSLKQQIPTFHFSELLCIAFGVDDHKKWFKRHLVDPVPLLKEKGLV
ncbi:MULTISPECIES: CoB--CoM heterodisulfide reductase iron-sulfur subunit B family protein [Desulfosediminicola]|uniref:CoB--CoM heterodisulfide reductase iron-sulfur subunit B family protein n=1 Tax=Desulfosediminicola TaxID=2886823 RepID=UPI0010ACC9F6|nr:heterodisulfide reductase-related iron-sulfur binding cluster [Desulfosediminicola ganghwensis]